MNIIKVGDKIPLVDGKAIEASGGAPVINPLSVTENGTYNAPSGVDGYAPVTVNVPQGITPTGEITLTEEKSYDVTEKATAVVDFSATRANLAEAVTAKGVDTLPTSSFDTIATNIGLISGGGSLPSVISKLDGGSFTLASDTKCNNYYIQHNLGVVPKGFIIWNEDVEQYTAGTFRTMKNIMGIRRTLLKTDSSIQSLASDFFSYWNADGTPYYNGAFNYTTQAQVDREYTDSTIRFNYDSAVYGAGMTYKWLAWA